MAESVPRWTRVDADTRPPGALDAGARSAGALPNGVACACLAPRRSGIAGRCVPVVPGLTERYWSFASQTVTVAVPAVSTSPIEVIVRAATRPVRVLTHSTLSVAA